MSDTLRHAAAMLLVEAGAIEDCHTRGDGDWSGEDEAMATHDAMREVATLLGEEAERANEREQQLKGECLMLVDVMRDAYEVIKTIEGENSDEDEKLQDLRMSIECALAAYDDYKCSDLSSLPRPAIAKANSAA